jgi:hypothetical protein
MKRRFIETFVEYAEKVLDDLLASTKQALEKDDYKQALLALRFPSTLF